ncbi:HAD-superfamily hydrolase subfamily IA variant 3 [Penicillium cosmopolitanum]|uniref:HAD-superfamily hydrolase subfamily IA variant 3 n=1 Tax=Penicillium cosmopolitanum TaxID=1131564 RepID=A0A9W9W329_9EURO|nr:HAD-superfamily hydrolase subfamily IA variant 3 [Penicillium cosmopolitanum]KAJ5397671.1 HAD-superfamily hydrolase subfamily IA variant 3 [Penicillium cosmopolitanum]
MPKITEIFFDCDNTLVLSEELAFEACADLANEILESRNIDVRYTGDQLIKDFVGQNFRGMMVSLQSKFNFELEKDELEAYVKKEEDKVIAKLEAKAKPCVGASEVLERLYAAKKYGFAVVSSSALRRVVASIKKVDQDKYFDADKVYSAATSLPKPTSKPDPAIYLYALQQVGKTAAETVTVEDSKSGALSAIRAGIHTIAYVGSYNGKETQDEMAKVLTDLGAKVVMYDWAEFDKCLEFIENSPAEVPQSSL